MKFEDIKKGMKFKYVGKNGTYEVKETKIIDDDGYIADTTENDSIWYYGCLSGYCNDEFIWLDTPAADTQEPLGNELSNKITKAMKNFNKTVSEYVTDIPAPKMYTQEEVNAIRKEYEDKAFTDEFLRSNSYHFECLAEDKDVIEHRNVLGCEYHLREMIPLIERIGFTKFNELVIAQIDKNRADDEADAREAELSKILGEEE